MPTVRYRILRVGTTFVFDMPAWAAMIDTPPTEVPLPNGKTYPVQRAAPGRNQIDLMIEVPVDELWGIAVTTPQAVVPVEGGSTRHRKKQEDVV